LTAHSPNYFSEVLFFMIKKLMPDEYHSDIYKISPESLALRGIKAVILDIDNTLVTYDDAEPTESVLAWLEGLKSCGIKAAFISNNNADRVKRFNSGLNFPAFPDAGKPGTRFHRIAMHEMNVSAEETAVIGDQLFTDIWAGKKAGCYSLLVDPIKDRRDILTRSKRLLERPILRRYKKTVADRG